MNTVVNLEEFRNKQMSNAQRHMIIEDMETYRDVVLWLMDQDLSPKVVSLPKGRKRLFVHYMFDTAHEYWADADNMFEACEDAVNRWIDDGYPSLG